MLFVQLLGGKELDEVSIAIHGGGCAAVNVELRRPGTRAEQVVKAKFYRKPSAFEKPLVPRVGCSVLLSELLEFFFKNHKA